MATEFTALLLAGGGSTRMGRDKALLDWNGRPMIDHMLVRLRALGAGRIVVSGDRPAHGGIPDLRPGAGPVGGIASALGACPDGLLLVVPVDLPLLSHDHIDALVGGLGSHRAVAFESHPLPAALRLDAGVRAAVLGVALHAPEGAPVRAMLAALGARALPAVDAAGLRPCNSPADYAALSA